MIVEPCSYFIIPEDAQDQLAKITKYGNVRFEDIVVNPAQRARTIPQSQVNIVQNKEQKEQKIENKVFVQTPIHICTKITRPDDDEKMWKKEIKSGEKCHII